MPAEMRRSTAGESKSGVRNGYQGGGVECSMYP